MKKSADRIKTALGALLVCTSCALANPAGGPVSLSTQNVGAGFHTDIETLKSLKVPMVDVMIASLYESGYEKRGIEKDEGKALKYYKRAFKNGNSQAALKLGIYYWVKEAGGQGDEKADRYFIEGADMEPKAFAKANRILAGLYFYSLSQWKKAQKHLGKAAKNHNATAQLYLASMYDHLGENGEATFYLTRACTNKNATKQVKAFCNGDKVDVQKVDDDAYTGNGRSCPVPR